MYNRWTPMQINRYIDFNSFVRDQQEKTNKDWPLIKSLRQNHNRPISMSN